MDGSDFYSNQMLQLMHDHQQMNAGKHFEVERKIFFHGFAEQASRAVATHGLLRRLRLIAKALQAVFAILPPEQTSKPTHDSLMDASINVQAFITNAFGCLDNFAWVWVLERGVKDRNGNPLKPTRIDFGKSYD